MALTLWVAYFGVRMVLSHWCKLIEGLQASPLEFYKSVEEAIDRRKIPGLARSHTLLPEGGLLSAKREYLRLTRERLLFDICAAPFGTGFFVSCRLVDREFPWYLLILVLLAGGITILLLFLLFIAVSNGLLAAFTAAGFIIPLVLICLLGSWLAWRLLRGCLKEIDNYLLMSPAVGRTYERITRRNTYYRIDLIHAFHAAVQAALMDVIDNQIDIQHLTPLSEAERKPVLSKLMMG